MAQSLAKVFLHSIFSTKHREPIITVEIQNELHAYIGGIIKNIGGTPIVINSMPDHIHIFSTLPRTISISKYLEEIKKTSSKWIKTKGDHFQKFAWQNGYATFSVSSSKTNAVESYIQNQEEHHKLITFQEEVLRFLNEYQVEYDERFLWD